MARCARTVAASAAAAGAAAVFLLSGCSSGDKTDATPPSSTAHPLSTHAPVPTPDRPVPDSDTLNDVLNRLADPTLSGKEKVSAVQGATAEDLDKFTTAVVDAGFSPLSFTVKDPKWSTETAGDVVAMVTINSPNPKVAGLTTPMTFTPIGDQWQLSKATADVLLKAGRQLAAPAAPHDAPPAPAPAPTPGS